MRIARKHISIGIIANRLSELLTPPFDYDYDDKNYASSLRHCSVAPILAADVIGSVDAFKPL
jgi:hypothetical protein